MNPCPSGDEGALAGNLPRDEHELSVLRTIYQAHWCEQRLRLQKRLERRRAELAISQEWGFGDCVLITRIIAAMEEELRKLDALDPSDVK